MATFLLILASFAAIVVLFLFLSWYIRFQASILLKENELDYRIAVALGGRNMGIGFARIESMSYLFLGSPGRERFKWRLGGKKPEEKKVTAEAKEKQPISKRWPKITAIPYGKLLAAVGLLHGILLALSNAQWRASRCRGGRSPPASR